MDEVDYQLKYRHSSLKQRCTNPKNHKYPRYGGRGIKVCQRWLGEDGLVNFKEDMRPTFQIGLSLDRIDTNGNYEPSNCRWVTQKVQQNNRNNNRVLEFNGKKQNLFQWAYELGIKPRTLHQRLNGLHWSIEKALLTPVRKAG